MVLPSPLVTPEAQLQILEKKGCAIYLRPEEMTESVGGVLKGAPHVHPITVPALDHFLNETEASPVNYPKSWAEGKDDPWLVFHTSGTTGMFMIRHKEKSILGLTQKQKTGNPKPITYSHQMMAGAEVAASLPDIEETHIHQYAQRRWYTPLPSLHVSYFLSTNICILSLSKHLNAEVATSLLECL